MKGERASERHGSFEDHRQMAQDLVASNELNQHKLKKFENHKQMGVSEVRGDASFADKESWKWQGT